MELSTDMAELSWFWIELTDDAAATYELVADCADTELAADIAELRALDRDESAEEAELLDDEADEDEDEMAELTEDEMELSADSAELSAMEMDETEAMAAEFKLEEEEELVVVVVVVTVVRV